VDQGVEGYKEGSRLRGEGVRKEGRKERKNRKMRK
jgi:hypothetical protein